MKIIKTILLVTLTTFVCTALHAQKEQIKAEIAKPAESTVPPAGQRPALAPDSKPAAKLMENENEKPGSAAKQSSKTTQNATVKETEMAKPEAIPLKNNLALPEIIAEKRSDAKRPVPMIPAENTNLAPTPPAIKASKNTAVQQQQ